MGLQITLSKITAGSPTFFSVSNFARPAFTVVRDVPFTTKAGLDTALADMQTGDYIHYTGTGVLSITSSSGHAYAIHDHNPSGPVVIDFGCSRNRWDPSKVTANYVQFAYTGTATGWEGMLLYNISNLRIYGGEYTTGQWGGTAFRLFSPVHNCIFLGGYVSMSGGSGLETPLTTLAGVASTHNNNIYQFEVNRYAMNPAQDPHADKGTGQHGALLHGGGTFYNNKMAIYGHDPLKPGEFSAGKTWPEGAGGGVIEVGEDENLNYSGNTYYALGENCLMTPNGTNPGSTSIQTIGGWVFLLYGHGVMNNNVIGWVEGNHLSGGLLNCGGGTWWNTLTGEEIQVLHGRRNDVRRYPAGCVAPNNVEYPTGFRIKYFDCASVNAAFTSSVSGLTATFTDTSTGSSGPILAWHWDFGDGSTSTTRSPTHTYAAAGTYPVSLTVTGSGSDGSAAVTHSISVSVTPTSTSVIFGATTGSGSGNLHATPDLAGWLSYQTKTGTHAAVTKLFSPADGYPNLWTTWSGSLGAQFVANNGGHPVLVLIVFNNVPTAANFESLLRTLPAAQRVGFVYQSEAENSGSGISGASFVANSHTISLNLNTALSHLVASPASGNSSSFYTRGNFPIVNSAYMAYYSANPGSTAYIPAKGDVDAYGADLYHKGSLTNNVCTSDSRFAGYVSAVHNKSGTNVAFAFPEYGIDLAGISSDTARANLMAADYTAMTGTSRPGSLGLLLWNYWFEVGNSGEQYLFSLPSATATEWAQLNAL